MDLLANDLSVHEQFHDLASFHDALSQLMALRGTAKRYGREVQCNRMFLNTRPIPDMPMQQAIGRLRGESQRRAVMTWLTRSGPFWDDVRRHGEDDWLECQEEVVTETAVGEAAFRIFHGVDCGLVSLAPSEWCYSPLQVSWVRKPEELKNRNAPVENWWCAEALDAILQDRAPPLASWAELRRASRSSFARLSFAEECFAPLAGVPFAKGAAERFLALLRVLDRFAGAFEGGVRSAEGRRMVTDYFTGERAWFSDSSETEKREFRRELTFTHPEDTSSSLFCSWHGKVSHQTLRLHFSWPIEAEQPVYVVYAGPKITRR